MRVACPRLLALTKPHEPQNVAPYTCSATRIASARSEPSRMSGGQAHKKGAALSHLLGGAASPLSAIANDADAAVAVAVAVAMAAPQDVPPDDLAWSCVNRLPGPTDGRPPSQAAAASPGDKVSCRIAAHARASARGRRSSDILPPDAAGEAEFELDEQGAQAKYASCLGSARNDITLAPDVPGVLLQVKLYSRRSIAFSGSVRFNTTCAAA